MWRFMVYALAPANTAVAYVLASEKLAVNGPFVVSKSVFTIEKGNNKVSQPTNKIIHR